MDNFIVLKSIPEEFKKEAINAGAHGICYKTSDGEVYKEFMTKYAYQKDLEILSQIQSPFFAFPKKIIYLNKKDPDNLKGYIMDYVDGINFKGIDRKIKIDALIESALEVEKEIFAISKDFYISLFDLHNNNVLFQKNNKFKIIDTDLYEYVPYKDVLATLKANMMEWNEFFLYNLECMFECFLNSKLNLHFEIAMRNGKYKASDILSEVVDEIRKETYTEIDTLEDYYEGIKIIKKKEYL